MDGRTLRVLLPSKKGEEAVPMSIGTVKVNKTKVRFNFWDSEQVDARYKT